MRGTGVLLLLHLAFSQDSQETCQGGGKSLVPGIFCLNEDGEIPCWKDSDCPEDWDNNGQANSVFSYTCHRDDYDYFGEDYAGYCFEEEVEKECNKDIMKTDPHCIKCNKCIKAGINLNGDPCSVCKKKQTTKDCSCKASCDDGHWWVDGGFGGNPWVNQSDPWCQGCLKCIRDGLIQYGDPCSICKKNPLYENCDCKFPDCDPTEERDNHPWCQECRKCVEAGLDDNGDPYSLCKRQSPTQSCHLHSGWDESAAFLPNCTSKVPAGPWCDQCDKCWEAELQEGIEARCRDNTDFWGPKTEMCPTNFDNIEDGSGDAFVAVPPKKIAQTVGQSFRRSGGCGKKNCCPKTRPCRYSGGRCGRLVGLGRNGNIVACPKRLF